MMLGKEYILLGLPIKKYILLFDYVYFYMPDAYGIIEFSLVL